MPDLITIKTLAPGSMDSILTVESQSWPSLIQASKEMFLSRFNLFPEGFIGVFSNNNLAGFSTSMIIQPFDFTETTWETITDNGYCFGHDDSGETLYVVSIGVSPEYRNNRLGSILINEQINLGKKLGLKKIVVGARCPLYYKFDRYTIEKYVFMEQNDGQKFDPEIRFYERNGFSIVKIVPQYMKNDYESKEFGIIMSINYNYDGNKYY